MRRASLLRLTGPLFCISLTSLGGIPTALGAAPGGQADYDSNAVNYEPPATERRGGFAMGSNLGFGMGSYSGYELTIEALNDPNQRQSTGAGFASFQSLWLGGSPRDWLTLGLGGVGIATSGSDVIGTGGAFFAHVEGYPLYSLGGGYRDLGVGFSGGIGGLRLADADTKDFEEPLADSGALSMLSISVFWEPLRWWHFSFGPSLDYAHGFSPTMDAHQLTLSFRTSLYGVQPKKKREGG